jgi:hypothetical protein
MTPIIPASCVLCAIWLEEAKARPKTILLQLSIALIALVGILFCLFFIWFGHGVLIALVCVLLIGIMIRITLTMSNTRIVVAAVSVLLAVLLGGLYPLLGISYIPADIERIVGSSPIASFNTSQPSMLSIRVKRSAVQIAGDIERRKRVLKQFDGFVFMRQADTERFEALARGLGIFFEKAGGFKTFYSRHTWVRFAREDATSDDWSKAIRAHSLADLRSGICYYRVYPGSLKRES